MKWAVRIVNGKKIGVLGMLRTHAAETSNMGDSTVSREEEISVWIKMSLYELQRHHSDCSIIILLSSAKYSVSCAKIFILREIKKKKRVYSTLLCVMPMY